MLLPLDSTDGEGYLFRFFQEEGGNPRLENIDDEDEYSFAADVFENLMSQAGFLEPEEQEGESAQELHPGDTEIKRPTDKSRLFAVCLWAVFSEGKGGCYGKHEELSLIHI